MNFADQPEGFINKNNRLYDQLKAVRFLAETADIRMILTEIQYFNKNVLPELFTF